MILLSEAQQITNNLAIQQNIENVSLLESLNRILAEEIIADHDIPTFDKSAVDGYACRNEDLPGILNLIEIIPAGKNPEKSIGKNQCSKIMTGAILPKNADCVVMIEETEKVDSGRIRINISKSAKNVRYCGEDCKTGDELIKTGELIKPQHIAILATAGKTKIKVYEKVKAVIISTGDEVVEPENFPMPFQVRNSNAYQLFAQIKAIGGLPTYYGIAKDNFDETFEIIKKSTAENDVIILTGGVSMGDFDLVPEILEKTGFTIQFRQIAIQPGKPTIFAVNDKKVAFALPGNPVSTFVIFELLVKPFLMKKMGNDFQVREIKATIGETISRSKTSREKWIPVRYINGVVFPVDYHGSAHINSLIQADGIICMPIGKAQISKGETVDVRQI